MWLDMANIDGYATVIVMSKPYLKVCRHNYAKTLYGLSAHQVFSGVDSALTCLTMLFLQMSTVSDYTVPWNGKGKKGQIKVVRLLSLMFFEYHRLSKVIV